MMRRKCKILFVCALTWFGLWVNNGYADVIFYEGWENGIIPYQEPGFVWKNVGPDNYIDNYIFVDQFLRRAGQKSLRFSVNYDDPLIKKAAGYELRLEASGVTRFPVGQERWYAFSVYIPDNFISRPESMIITQFYGIPDTDLGEKWGLNPPFTLGIQSDHWKIVSRGDKDEVTVKGNYDKTMIWSDAPVIPGWTDFVFHIKWSYVKNGGFMNLWIDGQQQDLNGSEVGKTYYGPNCYNDRKGVFMKIGVYEWSWPYGTPPPADTRLREINFDEIRIGDENSSYAEVEPAGGIETCAAMLGEYCGEDALCDGGTMVTASDCSWCCVDGGTCQEFNGYSAIQTQNPPIIDGQLDEYSGLQAITSSNENGTVGNYWLMYDNQALYIAAEVRDDEINSVLTVKNANLWKDDSVELFFDTQHDGGRSLRIDDYKFFVNTLNTQRISQEWSVKDDIYVNSAVTVLNNLYRVEMSIDWSHWGISMPVAGTVWGFEAAINDRRDNGDVNKTIWSNSTGGGPNDPNGWGDLLFK